MRRVWVTRADPGAGETADRVRALGLDPLVEPLLEVRPTGDGPLDLGEVGALAFTSANAVRAFAGRSPRRDLPVFTVGAATAQAARDVGFAAPLSADRDVAALAALIIGHRATIRGPVLHASATEPAGDLVGDLAAAGVPARRAVLYETVARSPTAAVDDAVAHGAIALVHSPRAARLLADWTGGRDASALIVLCLSAAVAAGLGDLDGLRRRTAAAPDEASLMALLADEARGR